MNRPAENNLHNHFNISAALKAPMPSRKRRQLPTVVAFCCGLIILVVLVSQGKWRLSAQAAGATGPAPAREPAGPAMPGA